MEENNPSSHVAADSGPVQKIGRFAGPFARTKKSLFVLYGIAGGLVLAWLILGATAWRGFLGRTQGTALAADAIRVIGGLLLVIDLIACIITVHFRKKKMFLGFMILVAFFSVCILATWCLDAYNATVESGLLTANDAGFVAANNQYNILPITIAACIVGVVVWLIISYVFIVSLVVHRTTYDDITAGVTAPSA
eukprot:TRINITY_DN6943_c0_g1_i1.p1 TRINITY_DN6943_c0_g1~~TRINITY_DN6943_c0_g1_i1.p1  ORF type:complete len:194 (+),score=33.19 TRINITY_DN6943_c0_g1_i1:33-614(+)